MKKWIAIAVILMCCLVYAIVKLSMSENQNAYNQAEKTQSAKQINADNTDKATPEEDSGSDRSVVQVDVPAAQVEAVIKAFSEFKSAIKSEDYEKVWQSISEHNKSQSQESFEDFKKEMAEGAQAFLAELMSLIIEPESTIIIEGRVGLLVTNPEDEQYYFFFIQEDRQWKFYGGKPAQDVDTSKE